MIGRWLSGQGRGAVAALLVSLAGAGFSAHAGLSRGSPPDAVATAIPAASGYEADDHFPGAALLYADEPVRVVPDPLAAPGAGVTGTATLPDTPVPAIALTDATVRPAAPFALRGTGVDQSRALQCLTTAIYYEAASESDAGQSAVAQVVLNRVRHPAFPASVCGVVFQGAERAGCQFSFACDGAMARGPARGPWLRAQRAAAKALAGYVYAPVGLATHYHTYAVTPAWNRTLVMTDVVGAHFFHRWKGYWGTAAAFHQPYRGNEPMPGVHRPAVASTPTLDAATAALLKSASVPSHATPPPGIVAEHRDSGATLPRYAATTPDDQILDRWKDSGKPLK